jgi:hypothetical protein
VCPARAHTVVVHCGVAGANVEFEFAAPLVPAGFPMLAYNMAAYTGDPAVAAEVAVVAAAYNDAYDTDEGDEEDNNTNSNNSNNNDDTEVIEIDD